MTDKTDFFTPEQVEEQVAWLRQRSSAQQSSQRYPGERQLIQDLQQMYESEQADARSLEQVWRRLRSREERAPQPALRPPSSFSPRPQPAAGPRPSPASLPVPPPRGRFRARGVALTLVVLLVVLVGGLLTGLVLVHHPANVTSQPTATAQAGPFPSIYLAFLETSLVTALNGADGSTRWRYQAAATLTSVPIVADGVVYLGAIDGSLTALNASDGRLLWQAALGDAPRPPLVAAGVVYTGNSSEVFALQASDGKVLWHTSPGGQVVQVVNGIVYANDRDISARRASDGKVLWDYLPQGDGSLREVSSGHAFISETRPMEGPQLLTVLAADTGSLLWHYAPPNSNLDLLALDQTSVYMLSDENSSSGFNTVQALNSANGTVRWRTPISGANLNSGGILQDGLLMLGSQQGLITALNPSDGAIRWQAQTSGVTDSVTGEHGLLLLSIVREGVTALHASDGSVAWQHGQFDSTIDVIGFGQGVIYAASEHQSIGQKGHNDVLALDEKTGKQLWLVDMGTTFNVPTVG